MGMRKCIACDAPATKRITVDVDIPGIRVCDEHVDEVRREFMFGLLVDDFEYFDEKYYGDKPVDEQD